MKIAIIGAGLTGLTAGYRLAKTGCEVTIFEKENFTGGLASGFDLSDSSWKPDRLFHHLFTSDTSAKRLLKELKIPVIWPPAKTSIFLDNKIFQFDSPSSILKAPIFSPTEKIRTGIATVFLKTANNWTNLEKYKAIEILPKLYGKNVYEKIWQPLLKSKFDNFADQVSLTWFWARIKKRSAKLGYISGGFQVLADRLSAEIKKSGGQVFLNHEVKEIKKIDGQLRISHLNSRASRPTSHISYFDRVLVTAPTSTFANIAVDLPADEKIKLQSLQIIGAINLILILEKQFLADDTYWLNINDSSFPFVAVVEHTNYIDKKHYSGNHIVYIGGYYSQNHRYFNMTGEKILKELLTYLKRINPNFNSSFIIHHSSFKFPYAQPIVGANHSKIIPSHDTSIPNVFLANMQQIYPWDRGINYAIEMGENIAKIILQK